MPADRGRKPAAELPRALRRDLRTLAIFLRIYCDGRHTQAARVPVTFKTHDVEGICRGELRLCEDCRRLLLHAWVKRTHCQYDPKPACKDCPQHCYAPDYRARIREVMRYSGWRLIRRGRVDYLLHMLF